MYTESIKNKVYQNISELDSSILNVSIEKPLTNSEISAEHLILLSSSKLADSQKYEKILDRLSETPETNVKSNAEEKTLRAVTMEINFLQQSVNHLQSQMFTKCLEIESKDDNILKLEKIVLKQKKKLKELRAKVMTQEEKIISMEKNLPKYNDILDTFNSQEEIKYNFDKKYDKLENILSVLENQKKKTKISTPRAKPQSPYRILPSKSKNVI